MMKTSGAFRRTGSRPFAVSGSSCRLTPTSLVVVEENDIQIAAVTYIEETVDESLAALRAVEDELETLAVEAEEKNVEKTIEEKEIEKNVEVEENIELLAVPQEPPPTYDWDRAPSYEEFASGAPPEPLFAARPASPTHGSSRFIPSHPSLLIHLRSGPPAPVARGRRGPHRRRTLLSCTRVSPPPARPALFPPRGWRSVPPDRGRLARRHASPSPPQTAPARAYDRGRAP
ncbi:hypothetical protein B0H17DRAFT_1075519, partial [Mycena rosella]